MLPITGRWQLRDVANCGTLPIAGRCQLRDVWVGEGLVVYLSDKNGVFRYVEKQFDFEVVYGDLC